MPKKKLHFPKNYIVVDRTPGHTTYLQDHETGKMEGRKYVKGIGDKTRVRRVKKGEWAGIIIGRTPAVPVRGDSGKRGTVRRRL